MGRSAPGWLPAAARVPPPPRMGRSAPGRLPPAPGGYPPPPPAEGIRTAASRSRTTRFHRRRALSWAWNKFSKNAVPLLVATLVYGLIAIVLSSLVGPLLRAVSPETFTAYETADGLVEQFHVADRCRCRRAAAVQPCATRSSPRRWARPTSVVCSISLTGNRSYRLLLPSRNVGSVILAALVVSFAASVGLVLCILPGLLVLVLAWFTTVAIVDRNLSPIDGIRPASTL